MFGDEVKDLRISQGISLREFCKATGEDPSNWSKIERGLMAPPTDHVRLERIASELGIPLDASTDFVAKAEIAAGSIPQFVMTNEVLLSQLPAFLRTVDNVKPTEEDFRKIIEILSRGTDGE
jgi:transcriptional regulator with XRE-family HTH domain